MKEPLCKICGGAHYQSFCFQKKNKPIAVYKPLQRSTKPMSRVSAKKFSDYKKPVKYSSIPQKSTKPKAVLIARLDRIFSLYIRRKDAIDDRATCVTCDRTAHWKTLQNGHYISRRKMSTRWDEINCHVQCSHCNETLGGNLKVYKRFMIQKYGEKTLETLRMRSMMIRKLSTTELQELIDYYTRKCLTL